MPDPVEIERRIAELEDKLNRFRWYTLVEFALILYMLWHFHGDINEIGRALGLPW